MTFLTRLYSEGGDTQSKLSNDNITEIISQISPYIENNGKLEKRIIDKAFGDATISNVEINNKSWQKVPIPNLITKEDWIVYIYILTHTEFNVKLEESDVPNGFRKFLDHIASINSVNNGIKRILENHLVNNPGQFTNLPWRDKFESNARKIKRKIKKIKNPRTMKNTIYQELKNVKNLYNKNHPKENARELLTSEFEKTQIKLLKKPIVLRPKQHQKKLRRIIDLLSIMRLFSSSTKLITIFNCVDYPVFNERCVPSYFKTQKQKLGKVYSCIISQLSLNNCPTAKELSDILNKYNIGLNVYAINGELIQTQKYKKKYKILIHNNHMYVIKNKNTVKNTKILDPISFDKKMYEIEKSHRLQNFDYNSVIFKNTKYVKDYLNFKDINNIFKFLSPFSQINQVFFDNCGIRPIMYCNGVYNECKYDLNKCYPTIMTNPKNKFFITLGTEVVQIYKNSNIVDCDFYRIMIPNNSLGAFYNNQTDIWVCGKELKQLKTMFENPIQISHVIKSNKRRNGTNLGCLLKKDKCDICIKYKKWQKITRFEKVCRHCLKYKRYYAEKVQDIPVTKKRGLCKYCIAYESYVDVKKVCSHYDPIDIVFYSGYIAKKISRKVSKYTVERNGYEEDIFSTIYSDRFSISQPKNTDIQDVVFNVHNDTVYKKAGLFVYMNIISYTRTKLLKLFQIAREIRPNIKVVRIYNDSISFDHNVKLVEIYNNNLEEKQLPSVLSEIKNEKIHDYEATNSSLYNLFKEKMCNKYTKRKVNTYYAEVNEESPNFFYDQSNNPKNLVDSFCIFAFAGLGKSYFISHRIIPELEKKGKSILVVSTTLENSKYWVKFGGSGKAINHYIKSCDALLRKDLGKYDYIIIDEVSQLTMEIISRLENIKKLLGTKFILIGDPSQCTGVDNIHYLNTFIIHRLCDFNIVKIKFHTKGRYENKKYYNFLCNVLKFSNSIKRLEYIQEHIETVDIIKGKNPTLITWTNASKIPLKKKYNYKVETIHITQGKTIEDNLYVCLDKINDKKIIYTALSRVRGFQFIKLITIKVNNLKLTF